MSELQLFRVTVTETLIAEAEALVWATDRQEAERAAKREVEFDAIDAESEGLEAMARVEPFDTAVNLTKRTACDFWLIMPTGRGDWDTVELDEFRALLDPERMERARLAAIERGNGQLQLLGGQP
jgi:hypothetical protein